MPTLRITCDYLCRDSVLYFSILRLFRLAFKNFPGLSFCLLKEENSRIWDLSDRLVCKF